VLAHGCMLARGERAHGSSVETVALRGISGDPLMRTSRQERAHRALGMGQ
jgi:hypothetical protein